MLNDLSVVSVAHSITAQGKPNNLPPNQSISLTPAPAEPLIACHVCDSPTNLGYC